VGFKLVAFLEEVQLVKKKIERIKNKILVFKFMQLFLS